MADGVKLWLHVRLLCRPNFVFISSDITRTGSLPENPYRQEIFLGRPGGRNTEFRLLRLRHVEKEKGIWSIQNIALVRQAQWEMITPADFVLLR